MTELVISNEQFKNASGMVEAGLAANAHKFVAEMKLVAEAVLETGEKLLVGRRKINEATGGFTQSFYVPASKADLITRNINVRRDSYRNRDDLEKKVVDLQNAEIVTGRRDVVMAERRYDYESANARRLGIRDIHAAGGLADKAKYRDLEHPYATAMYLPFDKAAYDAKSGRTRAGWVQSQFNRAMSGESRNERSFARDQQAQADAARQQKEADKQAREAQRNAEKQARAAAQAQKAQQRAQEKQQKEQERQQKAAEREELRRKKEEQRAEEQSNRERLVLFAKIGVMLASVVALIRGISTSLLGAQSRAAGSSQSRLPEGFDLSTPILDGFKEAFSKLDFLGIFTPLVNAVTETVQKIRVQTLEGLQTGLTAAEVRLYDTNDVAHQLAAGTTVGAMKGLTQRAANIITLAKENNLGDDYAKMIMGSGLITELTDYSMGKGGYTTAGVFEDLIDAYFKQFKSGKNAIGHAVAPELLMQELTKSITSLMGEDAASVLNNMMLNSLAGSYYSPYNNFEEWMSSTRTMQLMNQGAFAIPKEQLAYANVQSARMSDIEASFQALFDKFFAGMYRFLDSMLDAFENISYWFMSDADKQRVDEEHKRRNEAELKKLSPEEELARKNAAAALGISEDLMLKNTPVRFSETGRAIATPGYYAEGLSDEQIARYMEWAALYELTEQLKEDNKNVTQVPYRKSLYTQSGRDLYKRDMAEGYLAWIGGGKRFRNVEALKNVSDDSVILGAFLEYMGLSGNTAEAGNQLFTAALSSNNWADYVKDFYHGTDFLDQLVKEGAPNLYAEARVSDMPKEVIQKFYDEVWSGYDETIKAALMEKAFQNITGNNTNLRSGGAFIGQYKTLKEHLRAVYLEEWANSILGMDISGAPSAYTAPAQKSKVRVPVSNVTMTPRPTESQLEQEALDQEIKRQIESYYIQLYGRYYGTLLNYGGTSMGGELIPALRDAISYAVTGQTGTGGNTTLTLRVMLDKGLRGELPEQAAFEDFNFDMSNNTLTIRENK